MPVYSLVFDFIIMTNVLISDGKKVSLLLVHANDNFKSSISLRMFVLLLLLSNNFAPFGFGNTK